jgi:Cu-processing system permease protein
MKTLLLTRFTLKELVRRRLMIWALALSVFALILFAAAMFAYYGTASGNVFTARELKPFSAQMEMMSLYMITFVATLLAILTSTGTIAGEVDSGTLLAVLPKPISRWEVLAGKLLAYAAVIGVYIVVMSACLMAISWFSTGIFSPLPLPGVLLMVLSVLTLLVVAILGSTISSTIAAAIVVLMLYGFGWAGGLIEMVGRVLDNATLINIGTISNLLIPGNKIWQYACYYLTPEAMSGATITLNPFFGAVQPSLWMILYALVYIGGISGLAAFVFTRKDL